MSLATIRSGLVTRLNTITGLHAHAYAPSKVPQTPAAFLTYQGTEYYAHGATAVCHKLRLTVLHTLAPGHERAQAQIDGYCDRTGTTSIPAAINGDATLGGAAVDTAVRSCSAMQGLAYGGAEYVGLTFDLEVYV